jgi:hypothetical protein
VFLRLADANTLMLPVLECLTSQILPNVAKFCRRSMIFYAAARPEEIQTSSG